MNSIESKASKEKLRKVCFQSIDSEISNDLFERLTTTIHDVSWCRKSKNDMSIDADLVFVFRWPFIIKKDELEKKKYIGFHTSNLPDGRGGSPLQNQIFDDILWSRVNAIKLVEEVDAGPIYCHKDITLQGSIADVWRVISSAVYELIQEILLNDPSPKSQDGVSTKKYRRRTDNSIASLSDVAKLYKFIQMLDGEDYPPAYLDFSNFRIEFTRASMKNRQIICDAKFSVRT